MAVRLVPACTPEPAAPESPAYAPDEGNVFSTIQIQQVRDCYMAVEHPAKWSADQLQAALGKRAGDVAAAAQWWDAETATSITEAVLGKYEPDDTRCEPLMLGAADLVAAKPIPVLAAKAD